MQKYYFSSQIVNCCEEIEDFDRDDEPCELVYAFTIPREVKLWLDDNFPKWDHLCNKSMYYTTPITL
jgi:hypothetical protein